ncbi:DUF2291 family protein [Streptomyces inhibens]|uniref:DUF2291 family protein n=1 Tax=Streptomyces inhibens TaxID=2293571 RepID=UPI001EE7467C|nr:DUF2291 family protein [Streptomyces inhibens]UKY54172.1 DUF2291 domain-containing protein [Streptomyces inhibens]
MTTIKATAFTRRRALKAAAGGVLLVGMVLNTTVISDSAAHEATPGAFSPAAFAEQRFASKVVPEIDRKAAPLADVAKAIAAEPSAAAKNYGAARSASALVFSVTFSGTAGKADDTGLMPVTVQGLPPGTKVFVQTGPAINGTAVRDATKQVKFGDFKNQVEYQNVGAELNEQVKKIVLGKVDRASLNAHTVAVTGVFEYVNPTAFIVTPVKISEEK